MDDLPQGGDGLGIVGEGFHQGGMAGVQEGHAAADQGGGIDQEAGGGAFVQVVILEGAQGTGQDHQSLRQGGVDGRLPHQNGDLQFGMGEAQAQGDEALPGAGFHALEEILVAGVVGDHQHEAGRRLQGLAGALQDEDAAVVGQGVQDHGGVLARLHHLVQVADGPFPHRPGQGAIGPEGPGVADQVAPHQVRRGQVVMAGHGVEGPAQALGHVAHQAGLAAAGGALDHHRQAVVVGVFEEGDFPALGLVVDARIRSGGGGGSGANVGSSGHLGFLDDDASTRVGRVWTRRIRRCGSVCGWAALAASITESG
jgi:hypothetical protein